MTQIIHRLYFAFKINLTNCIKIIVFNNIIKINKGTRVFSKEKLYDKVFNKLLTWFWLLMKLWKLFLACQHFNSGKNLREC
jgi:hypothetical protein